MRYINTGVISLSLLVMQASAIAASPTEAANFVVADNGVFVVDAQTELAWSRCVEGMQWDGKTCLGTPVLATYAEAQALAKTRAKADGLPWRVPRVKELQSFFSKAAQTKKTKALLLPASPSGWHWSGSANIQTQAVNQYQYKNIEQGVSSQHVNSLAFLNGWVVHPETGEARDNVFKREKFLVRLVCQR
jgi:Protein of unknown function (DUF1566)